MQRLFGYEDNNDSEVFFPEIEIPGTGVTISACTTANKEGRANEDSFAVAYLDKILWIGIFDGTTSLRPLEKLNGVSGARYASHFLKDNLLLNDDDRHLTPQELLLRLNSDLFEKAKAIGGQLSDTHSLPASMATIMKIDLTKDWLELAHVGDATAILYDNNLNSTVITEDRNKVFDENMFELMKSMAQQKGITNRQARGLEEFKKALYEMFIKRNNNPDGLGSGFVNGDPNFRLYMQTSGHSLKNTKMILAATDGLEIQGGNIEDGKYRLSLYEHYLRGGFPNLINKKRESEDQDPDWKFVRYKHSDDATGVMIRLGGHN